MSEGNSSNSCNSDSTLSSVSGSSGTRTEMSEVSSVDSTSIIDDLLGIVAQVHDQMEIGMEDNTIQWGKKLIIQDLSEDDALTHFRFRKVHLQEVADKLWPRLQCFLRGHRGSIKVNNGTYSLPYETLLLLVLFRLSRPRRIRKEMEGFFGMHKSKISTGITCMIHAMHTLGVQYLDNPVIFHNRMPYYAERVYQKCGLVETVWGFIDGTLRKTCRPSLFQKLMYSGHKRCHGIKFQSVVTPDGLFASMYGPVSGNRHDSFLLSNSGLLNKLQEFMPDDAPEDIAAVIYSLYGDPAYPQSIHIFGGYKNPADGSAHAHWCSKFPRFVRLLSEALQIFLHNSYFRISELP